MKNSMLLRPLALSLFTASLVACDGGGDSSSTPTNPTPSVTLKHRSSISTTTVPKAQTISGLNPLAIIVKNTTRLDATSSSGLPIKYSSSTPAVCFVTGNIVTAVAVGTCTIYATQTGNAEYSATNQHISELVYKE